MKNQRGSALLSVLVFATVVAVLSVPLFNSVLQDRFILAVESQKTQNHYAVESIVEIIKASDKQNPAALQIFVNELKTEHEFINNVLKVPVEVDMNATSRELTIETKGNRKISNLKGEFQFINTDIFLANLFVTKKNGKTPEQNIGLTPNCNGCTANHFRSNVRDYFSDIDPDLFDNEFNQLKAELTATEIEDKCLTVGKTEYSHLKCHSINNPNFPETTDLVINDSAFVYENFKLKDIESITIHGDLVVGGDIQFTNVKKVTVHGKVIANGTIEIKNAGGGNSNDSGVLIDVKGLISGSTANSNNIINIHAHGDSMIFQRYLDPTYDPTLGHSEGTFFITNWKVNVTH